MPGLTDTQAEPQAIALSCTAPDELALAAAFCSELAGHLRSDLKRDVSTAAQGAALKVAVMLRKSGANGATVTITTDAGSQTLTLTSFDSRLNSGSARTLVYPIAQQLGLL